MISRRMKMMKGKEIDDLFEKCSCFEDDVNMLKELNGYKYG